MTDHLRQEQTLPFFLAPPKKLDWFLFFCRHLEILLHFRDHSRVSFPPLFAATVAMFWVGGTRNRYSRGANRDGGEGQIQKAHFAKVSAGLRAVNDPSASPYFGVPQPAVVSHPPRRHGEASRHFTTSGPSRAPEERNDIRTKKMRLLQTRDWAGLDVPAAPPLSCTSASRRNLKGKWTERGKPLSSIKLRSVRRSEGHGGHYHTRSQPAVSRRDSSNFREARIRIGSEEVWHGRETGPSFEKLRKAKSQEEPRAVEWTSRGGLSSNPGSFFGSDTGSPPPPPLQPVVITSPAIARPALSQRSVASSSPMITNPPPPQQHGSIPTLQQHGRIPPPTSVAAVAGARPLRLSPTLEESNRSWQMRLDEQVDKYPRISDGNNQVKHYISPPARDVSPGVSMREVYEVSRPSKVHLQNKQVEMEREIYEAVLPSIEGPVSTQSHQDLVGFAEHDIYGERQRQVSQGVRYEEGVSGPVNQLGSQGVAQVAEVERPGVYVAETGRNLPSCKSNRINETFQSVSEAAQNGPVHAGPYPQRPTFVRPRDFQRDPDLMIPPVGIAKPVMTYQGRPAKRRKKWSENGTVIERIPDFQADPIEEIEEEIRPRLDFYSGDGMWME